MLAKKIFRTLKLLRTELGEFDDNFTWSAMVLAAQGKKINQISMMKLIIN